MVTCNFDGRSFHEVMGEKSDERMFKREFERLGVRDTSIDNSVLLQMGMVAKLRCSKESGCCFKMGEKKLFDW